MIDPLLIVPVLLGFAGLYTVLVAVVPGVKVDSASFNALDAIYFATTNTFGEPTIAITGQWAEVVLTVQAVVMASLLGLFITALPGTPDSDQRRSARRTRRWR